MRKSGILMPISALPAKHYVGDFGQEAYDFANLIKQAGFKMWQILPLNPLGYGNSPYQPFSSKALDEIYVSLEMLYKEGLIKKYPKGMKSNHVDYASAKELKRKYLKEAFDNFVSDESFEEFKKQKWVKEYAVFISFKRIFNMACWTEWSIIYKNYPETLDQTLIEKHQSEIEFESFIQYILVKQFKQLKAYVNSLGIEIIGDIPFYVGIDSDDVWYNQKAFLLNRDGTPAFIAGVPPDFFSATGQRWGNPIYDWDHLRKTNYDFWMERLNFNRQFMDIIRIDHFRAFDTYWKIDAKEETAINGEWIENTGDEFFHLLYKKYPDIQLIAEDLGDIRPEVTELKEKYNLKGMHIVVFDFDGQGIVNEVSYTGTHDNESVKTWFEQLNKENQAKVRTKINKKYPKMELFDGILQYSLDLNSELVILPVIDILKTKDRINLPGTVGEPNWNYKIADYKQLKRRIKPLRKMIQRSNRL